MSIRVLQVLTFLGGGGVETLLLDLQKKIPPHIHFDYLVQCHNVRDKDAEELGSTIHVFPAGLNRKDWANYIANLAKENNYDVVHYHKIGFGGAVMKAARKAGIKTRIAHSHSTQICDDSKWKELIYAPYHYTLNRWNLAKHATNIIGCSSDALRFLMGSYSTLPQCEVLLNGTQIAHFIERKAAATRQELHQKYGIAEDRIVIGNVGRLHYQKNQKFLLQVARCLVKERGRNKFLFFVAGDGELRNELETEIKRLELEDNVLLAGYCDNVPALLANLFDGFLFPSLFEGLPVVLIEAVAAGLSCVVADTITKDITAAFPRQIQTLSLQQSCTDWAVAVEKTVSERLESDKGIDIIRESPFNFDEHFVPRLVEVYEGES
ncbi:putative glycosyltransferase EpsF [Planctomycetales bacterium]|nr:putative glycosyltransferase EpsF [Planctomycetales bacterium]